MSGRETELRSASGDHQASVWAVPASVYTAINVVFLVLAVGAVAVLAALDVTPANIVRNPLSGELLPDTCAYVIRTGKPCSACGITRSMISAAHGDFARSRAFHFAGVPLFAMLLVQCGLRVAFLWRRVGWPLLDVIVSASMALALAWMLNGW